MGALKTQPALSPLNDVLKRAGAHMAPRAGWMVAADFGSVASELAVSRAAAGLGDVSSIGKLEFHGSRPALARMGGPLSTGRAARDAETWWCRVAPELLLVLSTPAAGPRISDELEKRAATAGVRLVDVTAERVAVCLIGPAARHVLARAGVPLLPEGAVRSESIDGIPTLVLHQRDQRWLLVAPAADAADLWRALSVAGAPLGLAYVGDDALQHLLAAGDR